MRPRRFDKQLQFLFTVLCALMLLVGVTSIGVNHTLGKTHEQVLAETIPVIRRAERVGADADLARGFAERLVRARTEDEIALATEGLTVQIELIEEGLRELRHFLSESGGEVARAATLRDVVADMAATARAINRLTLAMWRERARLETAGARLAAIVSAQDDLARLRVTAGIWQMYASSPSQNLRPALDRLADQDFFAYERIGELSEAVAEISRLIRRIADSRDRAELDDLEAKLQDVLDLALARSDFLPSRSAADEARSELQLFDAALEGQGLLPLTRELLATEGELAALVPRLNGRLAALSEEARLGREAARAKMSTRIAETGRLTMVLTASLTAVMAAGAVAGGLVWLYARRRIVSRLGAVSERIVQVAQGDTGAPMPISGHDEIGRLEKAVNVLRRRTEEAARLRESLEAAVLARTADVVAEMRLADAARAEAEEASRAKTHFLARMSHEIRTPLNGVVGLLDLALADETDPARRERLTTALISAQDLRVLTDDILTFSSGEDRHAEATRAVFDPAALARHLGEHLRALARDKGLAVWIRIPDHLPPALLGEPLRIRQVVGNLISNAVKYTDAGEVRLDVTHEAAPGGGLHALAFIVTDTGCGMTAQEAFDAFDIYARTDAARRRGVQGTGLGLAIARQLTDAMGGELRVSSEPGKGSRFTLWLRLPSADPAELPAESDAPPVLPARQVLVVDDHPVNRLVARGYLERLGCAVTEAATGTEALQLARDKVFDAILIDLDLPDLNGAEVAARIERKGARVAIATADLVADDAGTRARFGADHILVKPVSSRELALVLSDGPAPLSPTPGPQAAGGETDAVIQGDVQEFGPALATEIVAGFLDDLSQAVRLILSAEDDEERRRAAHRLRGASANFALHEFCDLLRRIESRDPTARGMLDAAARQVARLMRDAATRSGLQLPPAAAKQ